MVTPVESAPERNVQKRGTGPRLTGRSEGWTLRQPKRGRERTARGIRCEKQATQMTSGSYAASVSSVSEAERLLTSQTGSCHSLASCRILTCRDECTTGSSGLAGRNCSCRKIAGASAPALEEDGSTTARTSIPPASNAWSDDGEKRPCMPKKMTRGARWRKKLFDIA